jgi:hypothetical protein
MTPRERAEELVNRLDDVGSFAGAVELIEDAITEHVRALLADDETTVEAIVRAHGDYPADAKLAKSSYGYRAAARDARAVLAALRGKAFAQWRRCHDR